MDEAASETAQEDGVPASPTDLPKVITIAPKGDILLDVTFETSKSTLKAARAALPKPRPGQRDPPAPQPLLKPRVHLAYRVDLSTLKKHSRYFTNLLTDTRFQEARAIESRFRDLSLRNEKPADAESDQLPRVVIIDDDEATRSAGREDVFRDLLRILHGGGITTRPVTMLYVATMAVMADRFACTPTLSRYLATGLKFKWPATPQPKPSAEVDGMTSLSLAGEEVLRQKVLVSWLLDHPLKFQAATRELVIYGSHGWSAIHDEEDEGAASEPLKQAESSRRDALWWFLPSELEEELHYRRTLILRTLASIVGHFLRLYSSRIRQCKLGYDSSAACDSFQLGEMVKFFAAKNLLFLVNFSPSSLDNIKDFAAVDVSSILAALRQSPHYQIDKNHTNCGLRSKITPILEYVQVMLSSNVVGVNLQAWKKEPEAATWIAASGSDSDKGKPVRKKDFVVGPSGEGRSKVFRFTRSLAQDQRLKYDGAMAADRMALELFMAEDWDWTPEDDLGSGGREFATTKWLK
ncbi:hypothetical protein N8I77_006037 [Diaporthe amygdali]|uniref:Hydroxyproline-rich glyco protein n=1 Tax=Phomopsis amygdali TaxID=1214568 RepID=A0AAD9W407_PHOAM|nr:hypothetical protein N8I77_006037 [Diaporthe amygdali]